jgi:hypothetical protein
MPRPLTRLLVILAVLGLLASVAAAPAAAASANATRVYLIEMDGAQEAPGPGDPDASGEAIVIVNPNNDTVCFLMRWRDIDGTVTASHIHNGPAGVPAGVVVPLFVSASFDGTGQARGCVTDNGWADAINANPSGFYVNVHSTEFPPGAIRGQLD